ncbi:MAG: 3-oxoacyl-[acyl-carrier-protein] synthase III C-terminal domain-containing protein [Verrucomicrobiota bacterium]
MQLLSIASHVPSFSCTQQELWEQIHNLPQVSQLSERPQNLLERILCKSSGIHKRHFCHSDFETLFHAPAEELNQRFEKTAPELGSQALRKALEHSQLHPSDLDALLICTCTGYLCPGLSSHISESLELRSDCYLSDLVGIGCGAAIPLLRQASHFLAENPSAHVACIALEVCSSAFYLDDDIGVLISSALFADGASASIWTGESSEALASIEKRSFRTLHWPEEREKLRFKNSDGKLRNVLHSTVPEVATRAVQKLIPPTSIEPNETLLIHPGGARVIRAIREAYPNQDLGISTHILEQFGNLSSPSILFCLEHALQDLSPRDNSLWLCSFGAGFSAHACRISR